MTQLQIKSKRASQDADPQPRLFIIEQTIECPLVTASDTRLTLEALTREALLALVSATVMFPLFGKADDATAVLARLTELGYQGRCIVVSPKLPRKDLVLKELKTYGPGLEIDLLEAEPKA